MSDMRHWIDVYNLEDLFSPLFLQIDFIAINRPNSFAPSVSDFEISSKLPATKIC